MHSALPAAIRVERVRDDVSYQLPVRRFGALRWLGLFPIAFGLLFVSVPAWGLIGRLKSVVAGKADVGDWIFVVFLIPFIAAGLLPIGLGLLGLCGRCRVEWFQKRLSILDSAGPVRWRRRLPTGHIRKFVVKSGGAKINDKPVTSGPLAEFGALFAEFEEGKARMVALGYPRDWLQSLAKRPASLQGATNRNCAGWRANYDVR